MTLDRWNDALRIVRMMLKGRVMVPLLVTFKIVFVFVCLCVCVCSLDIFLLKNVIIFFFGKKNQNGAHLKNFLFLTNCHIFQSPGKRHKHSFSTYLTYIHACILFTLLTCFAFPILQQLRIYHVWFLFGTISGADSYSSHFGAINY